MAELIPLNALGGADPRQAQHRDMRLTEVPNLAFASVAARRGQEDACARALADWLGADVPGVAKYVDAGARSAFWTGRDQWFVTAPYDTHSDLAAEIKAALGPAASVTEQTDGWAALDLTGAHVTAVMELCCALDLRHLRDPETAQDAPALAERTSIHHIGCYVLCLSPDHLRLIGPRSMADSLFHAVETEMRAI